MGNKTEEKYYTDYPTIKIGGGNPYHKCAFCDVSEPEINGSLTKHRSWCAYRIEKEKEILNEGEFTMAKLVAYLKANLTVEAHVVCRDGRKILDIEMMLGDELIADSQCDID